MWHRGRFASAEPEPDESYRATKPDKSYEPDNFDEPTDPDNPDEPDNFDEPAESCQPVEPAKPGKQIVSIDLQSRVLSRAETAGSSA